MKVIGTAGHVDHGKSTLVEALTGINPDRLKEEQERQMTIDLGFAWVTLPDGEEIGVVDVPGHRDFIENMLAGVGGIDAALFVVAADEGVMPQTREHLAILDLLQIPAGVVALTKADLAEGDDWLDLVAEDLADVLAPTVLASAPIVPVSAHTGLGLDALRAALAACLAGLPPRRDTGRPRLAVDRVFSLAGFGTVVTGTAVDGSFRVGDEVTVFPSGKSARVRGLQTHKRKLERSLPGSRVAINLTGVEVGEAQRGDVVAHPGTLAPSQLVEAQFRYLADAGQPLRHNAEVKLFVGAAEVQATVRLLGEKSLAPGDTGWAQFSLAHPVAVRRGDRFILRRPSPGSTIGGGVILDPLPRRKVRAREAAGALARLQTLARGTQGEILLGALEAQGPGPLSDAVKRSGLGEAEVSAAVAELQSGDQWINLDEAGAVPSSRSMVITRGQWNRAIEQMRSALAAYHDAQPLRAGMPREELKSRLGFTAKVFNALVTRAVARGEAVESGATVRLPSHTVQFSSGEQERADALLNQLRRDPFNSPSIKEAREQVGEEVLAVLLERGELTQISADVLLPMETYRQMVERVRAALAGGKTLTVAQVRDLFNASRKYALALMEHLDALGVTVRVGDERRLRG